MRVLHLYRLVKYLVEFEVDHKMLFYLKKINSAALIGS